MKLFPKLALMVSGLLLGTICYVSLFYYWNEDREIRQQAQAEQQQALQNLAHIAREAFITEDDLLLVEYIQLLLQLNPEMTSASVVDRRGQIRAHSEPRRIGKKETDSIPHAASVLILSQSVKLRTKTLGTASVGFSQQKLDEKLHKRLVRLRRRVATMTCLGLFLSLIGSFVMALSWTRPIKRLAQGAKQLGQGKWTVDLGPVEERGDELGFLVKAFQEMAFKLGELDRMKEDFVSAVTHELRSPLGAIESYLNLIDHQRAQGRTPVAESEYLQRIRLNTQRLTRFVNDLLDVSALERGKVELHCQAMDASVLAQDVLTLFEAKLQEKKLSSDLLCPPHLPNVLADPEKIHQVLTNLVSNAIKFTPEGGHIEISLEDLGAKNCLRICVTDTGLGIHEQDQLKIFNKFEQVQSARPQVKGPKGTGLGLSICRELVYQHGGEIGVTSRWGQGSTFFFTLPTAAPVALTPA